MSDLLVFVSAHSLFHLILSPSLAEEGVREQFCGHQQLAKINPPQSDTMDTDYNPILWQLIYLNA